MGSSTESEKGICQQVCFNFIIPMFSLNDWQDLDSLPPSALASMLTPLAVQRDKEAVIRIFERLNNEQKIQEIMKVYEADRRHSYLESHARKRQFTNMLEMLSGQEGRPPPAPPLKVKLSDRLEQLSKPKEDLSFNSIRSHTQRSDFRGLYFPDHPAALDTLLTATKDKMLLRTCPRSLVREFADPLFREHRWRIDKPEPPPTLTGIPGLKHREETWVATMIDTIPPAKPTAAYHVHASDIAKPSAYLSTANKVSELASADVVALPDHLLDEEIQKTVNSHTAAALNARSSSFTQLSSPMERSIRGASPLPLQISLTSPKNFSERATSHVINDPHPPGNVILDLRHQSEIAAESNANDRARLAGNINVSVLSSSPKTKRNTKARRNGSMEGNTSEKNREKNYSKDSSDEEILDANGNLYSGIDISDKGLMQTAAAARLGAQARMREKASELQNDLQKSSFIKSSGHPSTSNKGHRARRGLMLESVLADIESFEKNLMSSIVDSRFGNDHLAPPRRKTGGVPLEGGYAAGVGKLLKQKSAESAARRGVRDLSTGIIDSISNAGAGNMNTSTLSSNQVSRRPSLNGGAAIHERSSTVANFGISNRHQLEMSKIKDRPDKHDLLATLNVDPDEVLHEFANKHDDTVM